MAPKLFITGGTGYIGGTVLDTVVNAHPDYDITALLRNEPASFKEKYPNVKVVKGDYDSTDILTEAASKAEVVIHNGDSDHLPSLRALVDGLLSRPADQPSFLIHLSGTGVMSDWRTDTYLGTLNPKVYSDIEDLDLISSRPDGELHRHTDKFIFDAAAAHGDKLKTAIMCPPDIYGEGRGPGRTASAFVPVLEKVSREVGGVFYAGDGGNTRSWVHIEDLMKLYLRLIEAAVADEKGADWGKEGYYFASSQETTQIDIARAVGKIMKAHGRLDSAEPIELSIQDVKGILKNQGRLGTVKDLGAYFFLSNSRTQADRARRLFGYEPKAPSLWECLEADLVRSFV